MLPGPFAARLNTTTANQISQGAARFSRKIWDMGFCLAAMARRIQKAQTTATIVSNTASPMTRPTG